MSSFAVRLLAGALGVAAAGCSEPTFSVPTIPIGVLSVFTRSQEGVYVARPAGLFALAGSTPSGDSRSTIDTCEVGDYVPQSTIPNVEHVNAGDSILFSEAGAGTIVLKPINQFGVTVYAPEPRDVDFVPGSEITFTIPGASGGFPPMEITSLTPSAITAVSPISARPPLDEPLTVTWEPAGDDSSRFEVLLIYASQGALDLNQQVVCDWRDDGSGTIRPEWLSAWALSELQRIEVTRYRTQREQLGEYYLYLLATFDTVPQVAP